MIAERAVILAAGTSSRVGRQKLLMEFRGRTLIEYAIAAAQAWKPLVVAGPEVERHLCGRFDVELVANHEPQLGMMHSLAIADRAVCSDLALIVLLGDKPAITPSLIEAICNATADADVVYPVYEGVPGHPVRLSSRARRFIGDLPPGDTLRLLRDHPKRRRRAIQTPDAAAVFDLDTARAFTDADRAAN